MTKIAEKSSFYGGVFNYLFILCEDGKTRRTCVSPRYRNYQYWEKVIKAGPGTKLEGLELLQKDPVFIDADSAVRIKGEPEQMGLGL